ncbi:MAG: ACR3 family arsenite efflux transporter [Thermoplasmata archaeon]
MSASTVAAPRTSREAAAPHLDVVDRFLPVWVLSAMGVGLGIGRVWPGIGSALGLWQIQSVSVPIAVGLLLMMYPILARVRYGRVREATRGWRATAYPLILNWVVGPAFMFALAWTLLPDAPALRTGVILVGLARCIAMVLVWNQLAEGDPEYATVLVALNAIFQIVAYAGLAVFYLEVLPAWLHLPYQAVAVNSSTVALSVLVFLGVPLAAALASRVGLARVKGRAWYDERFAPRIARLTLYGLLFTVIVMFAIQGLSITTLPWTVVRVVVPLLAYFLGMWTVGYLGSRALGFAYARSVTVAFTAASNDFELAIAVAVVVFGVASQEAFASVIGPLVEVPVLLALVYVALWSRPWFGRWARSNGLAARATTDPTSTPSSDPEVRSPLGR